MDDRTSVGVTGQGSLQDRYQTGYCAEYAVALHRLNPELQFGLVFYPIEDDLSGYSEFGSYTTEDMADYQIEHVFCHDEERAYDSSGTCVLPDIAFPEEVEVQTGFSAEDVQAFWNRDFDMDVVCEAASSIGQIRDI